MYMRTTAIPGWSDPQGGWHSYRAPEQFPTALSYARRPGLGLTTAEAATHWWAWLGMGLIGGFSIGWFARQIIKD